MQINEKPAEIILRNARTPRGGGGQPAERVMQIFKMQSFDPMFPRASCKLIFLYII